MSARPSPRSKPSGSGRTSKVSKTGPSGHGLGADPTKLDATRGQARAAAAKATAPPRDPGGVWRAMLAQLPGGAGGGLIERWEDYAWARECGGQDRTTAERLAYDDVAAVRSRP